MTINQHISVKPVFSVPNWSEMCELVDVLIVLPLSPTRSLRYTRDVKWSHYTSLDIPWEGSREYYARTRYIALYTVGTPYNTNVGVQKIPDRAIWKPVVAKRNNTNPWSCSKPQILVTRDSRQVHMAEQPASRHSRLGSKFLPSCIHHRLPDNSLISVNL